MTLYVAYCHDRHLDPVVRVFSTLATAIDYARDYMESHVAFPEDLKEGDLDGYLFWIGYMDEEDEAWVKAVTLDSEE